LRKTEVKGRPLKVDFASDNKNGNNLKKEDVTFRDNGEIVKGNTTGCEYLDVTNSTVEEMLDNLSDDQEEMLLFAIKDIYMNMKSKQNRA